MENLDGFYAIFDTLPEAEVLLEHMWIGSHLMTIVGSLMYFFISAIAPVGYFIAVLGAIITYSVVIYRKNFLSKPFVSGLMPLSEAIRSENFHLLLLAYLWMITPSSLFKILQFFIYSVLNVLSYSIVNFIPPDSVVASVTVPLVQAIQGPLIDVASFMDLFLFGIMFMESILNLSFYGLILFFFIWCIRVEYSNSSRRSIYLFMAAVNSVLSQPNMPPELSENWSRFCGIIESILPRTVPLNVPPPEGEEPVIDNSSILRDW